MANGQYGPDNFVITSDSGRSYNAKYLKDFSGNYVMTSAGLPLVVPASYDLSAVIKHYKDIRVANVDNPLSQAIAYDTLINDFQSNHQGDLQAYFDGGPRNDWVGKFTDAASFNFGLGKVCKTPHLAAGFCRPSQELSLIDL